MLLQGFNALVILYVLIATIFLWLTLWISTRFIVTKEYASRRKFMLLFVALIMVVIIPLVSGVVGIIVTWPGDAMVWLRELLGGGGHNYTTALVPIIIFLLFLLILKFLAGMDWKDTTWVALIALFLLYMLYSLLPELDFLGQM